MWDDERKFYFDLSLDGKRAPVKSIAAFWTLLAKVASESQAAALAAELENPATFRTLHRVPTLAVNEEGFNPNGGYWNGAIWAPTERMVVRGLENYGYDKLAREIAMNHLDHVVEVYKKTGTLWENYAPQSVSRGKPSRGDFVGWTGIGPIAFLIEYAIGIKADAVANTVTWDIKSPGRVGIERLWFGGKTVSLVCLEPDSGGKRRIRVSGDGSFLVKVIYEGRQQAINIPAHKTVQIEL